MVWVDLHPLGHLILAGQDTVVLQIVAETCGILQIFRSLSARTS